MRIFIAIPLSEKLQTVLAETLSERSKLNALRIRPTAPQNIHITIKFLGEVDKSRIPIVSTAIQTAVIEIPAFEITLGLSGVFPNRKQPRILWIGGKTTEPLRDLISRVESQCSRIGFETEPRPFHLHATLARIQPEASSQSIMAIDEILNKIDRLQLPPFSVEKVVLFQSDLSAGKPRYIPLFTQNLKFVLG